MFEDKKLVLYTYIFDRQQNLIYINDGDTVNGTHTRRAGPMVLHTK